MQTLKIANTAFPYILSGKKTLTVIKGHKDVLLGSLLFESLSDLMKQVKVVQVTDVYYKKFFELTKEEAILAGRENLRDLKKSVNKSSPDITEDTEITVVAFEYNE